MRRTLTYWIVWTLAWLVARTVFLMRVRGARNMPPTGPVIVIANHSSHLDPPLVAVALHTRRMGFLAKKELWKSRLLGSLIETLGSIPIERGASDRRAYQASIEVLKGGGVLLVFPEGTRSVDGQLQEFQEGAARLAAAVPGCMVLPVRISGSFKAWGGERKYPKPHPVRIDVAPAFSTDDLRKQYGEKKSLFQAIQGEMLRRLSSTDCGR